MLINEPLKRRHGVLLFSPQPTKGTPVTPATAVGICNPTARMDGGLIDLYGLGSPSALFFKPGEAISRLSINITAVQTSAFLLRAQRVTGSVPWNTIAIGVVDDAGVGHAWQLPDTKIDTMELTCEAGGLLQANFDLVSIGLLSEPTNLVAANLAAKPLEWEEGVILKGGAPYECQSIRISLNHNLDPKHVLYGTAPTANKRAPKYLVEGNEVITFETGRYAKTGINLQADTLAEFALVATFTDIAGGGSPNTISASLAAAKYGEEEIAIGDDILYRATGRAKTLVLA